MAWRNDRWQPDWEHQGSYGRQWEDFGQKGKSKGKGFKGPCDVAPTGGQGKGQSVSGALRTIREAIREQQELQSLGQIFALPPGHPATNSYVSDGPYAQAPAQPHLLPTPSFSPSPPATWATGPAMQPQQPEPCGPSQQVLAQVGMAVGNAAMSFIGKALTTVTGIGASASMHAAPNLLQKIGAALSGAGSESPSSSGPSAMPSTAEGSDPQEELCALRAEVARLRAARAAPDVREIIDATDIDTKIARALSEALARDAKSCKRRREPERDEESDDDAAAARILPETKARPRRAFVDDSPEVPADVPRAAGPTSLPASVSPALHKAFLQWTGSRGTIGAAMKRGEWCRQVARRHKRQKWVAVMSDLGMRDPPATKDALVERALELFLAENPELAGGRPSC